MKNLSANDILQVWETGSRIHPVDRALLILARAFPETPLNALADLTVGQRNARLMALRCEILGPETTCRVSCPACGSSLEFGLNLPDLIGAEHDQADYRLSVDGYSLTYRLPTSRDLVSLIASEGPQSARRALIAHCVQHADFDGQSIQPTGLPEEVVQALSSAMLETDPLLDLRLSLECPDCQHTWSGPFDISEFFWIELAAYARRLLGEVNSLARAYGWREADILALSPARRQIYLEMAVQ